MVTVQDQVDELKGLMANAKSWSTQSLPVTVATSVSDDRPLEIDLADTIVYIEKFGTGAKVFHFFLSFYEQA